MKSSITLGLGPRDRRSEADHPDFLKCWLLSKDNRDVAQFGLEHLLWEQGVEGSSPFIPTRKRGTR